MTVKTIKYKNRKYFFEPTLHYNKVGRKPREYYDNPVYMNTKTLIWHLEEDEKRIIKLEEWLKNEEITIVPDTDVMVDLTVRIRMYENSIRKYKEELNKRRINK